MNEEWRDTYCDPNYQVSNFGRVFSKRRSVRFNKGFRMVGGKIMKTFIKKQIGYPAVALSDRRQVLVHELVSRAFVEGYKPGLHVNHKDGDKTNNHFENLEWVTCGENISHAYTHLGRVPQTKGKFGRDHAASKSVVRICPKTGDRKEYGSGMDAVREGFESSAISRCCNGGAKKHKGYLWEFA